MPPKRLEPKAPETKKSPPRPEPKKTEASKKEEGKKVADPPAGAAPNKAAPAPAKVEPKPPAKGSATAPVAKASPAKAAPASREVKPTELNVKDLASKPPEEKKSDNPRSAPTDSPSSKTEAAAKSPGSVAKLRDNVEATRANETVFSRGNLLTNLQPGDKPLPSDSTNKSIGIAKGQLGETEYGREPCTVNGDDDAPTKRRPRTPSDPTSEEIGISEPEALALTNLLTHYRYLVHLGMSLWRKMLSMVPWDTLEYNDERRGSMRDDKRNLVAMQSGILGKLNHVWSCLPAEFKQERRPLIHATGELLSKFCVVPIDEFVSALVRTDQRDAVIILIQDLQLDLTETWVEPLIHMALHLEQMPQLLISKGAQPLAKSRHLYDPLELAISGGNVILVKLLFNTADVRKLSRSSLLRLAVRVLDVPGTFAGKKHPSRVARYLRVVDFLYTQDGLFDHGDREDSEGRRALHCVRYPELAEALLKRGASITKPCIKGWTPLHSCVESPKTLEVLLDHRAEVNATDRQGFTPILHAVGERGNLESVRVLIEYGPWTEANMASRRRNPVLKHVSPDGTTAMHLVNCPKTAQFLIDKGLDVNALTKIGVTPLLSVFSVRCTSIDLVKCLLKHGADPNKICQRGGVPLVKAIEQEIVRGDGGERAVEMVRLLLDAGANVSEKNSRAAETALHLAARHGMLTTVQILLNRGAVVDAKNNIGQTPLHYSVLPNARNPDNSGIIQLLLSKGADVFAQDKDGLTPLQVAVIPSSIALLKEAEKDKN